MNSQIMNELKQVIASSVGGGVTVDILSEDFRLVGNVLDSMAVNNLILALEEHFGFVFDEEELAVETFETVGSLAAFVVKKVDGKNAAAK